MKKKTTAKQRKKTEKIEIAQECKDKNE